MSGGEGISLSASVRPSTGFSNPASQFRIPPRLLNPHEATDGILPRGGLLFLQAGRTASASFKVDHARLQVRKELIEFTRKGHTVELFTICLNFSTKTASDQFPFELRGPLGSETGSAKSRGRKSNHETQKTLPRRRLVAKSGIRPFREGHCSAMDLSPPGPHAAIHIAP